MKYVKSLAFSVATALALSTAAIPAATPEDQLVVATTMNNILTMDPAAVTGRDGVMVMNNFYDTLTILTADRELTPGLAESWDVAPDGQSVVLHLRQGVEFASGNPVTAADVIWSLERVLKLNLASASALRSRGFTDANVSQHLRAIDDHTVEITLPQPDDVKLLLSILSRNGPGSIIDSQTALQHEQNGDLAARWLTQNAAGSGPFLLTQWKSNEYIILTRNDNFTGDAPAMRRVMVRHLPESQSQRLMLAQGDIDVAYSMQAPDLQALANNDDIRVESTPGAGFYYLAMSMKDERFANPTVREALRLLIDYQGIDTAIMPYYGQLHQRIVSSGTFSLLPDPGYTLDVARARELLAEAGYPNGFNVTLRALSEDPFLKIATAVQATLAQAGIQAQLTTGSGDVIYGAMRDRNFELIIGRGGGGLEPHPDSNLRALAYNPDNRDEARLTNSQGWRTSFYDEGLNAQLQAALIEPDAAKQTAAYEEIQTYIDALPLPILPFSEVVDTAAYRADIEGLTVNPWFSRFSDITKNR